MNINLFELQLYQLETAFAKSRTNIYSDSKKEKHLKDLYNLFIAIKKSNYTSYTDSELNLHYKFFSFLFNGIEYLDNSTVNVIPYEILTCLEYSLKDFLKNDNIIIVTSFTPDNLNFYFQSFTTDEEFNRLNDSIEKLYKIRISKRLVRIMLPKSLSRDYLSMVALYHELGHFIDNELSISKRFIYAKYGFKAYQLYSESELKEYNHRMEYFADLFASQYVSNSLGYFLNIISYNSPESNSHPATKKRIEVIEEFLKGNNPEELNSINSILPLITGGDTLKIRFQSSALIDSDIIKLVPQDVNNIEELHGVFKLGWDFWLDDSNNLPDVISKKEKYQIINNLIEKSISIFTIQTKWKSAKI